MKRIYEFRTSKDGVLTCTRVLGGRVSIFHGDKAVSILNRKDQIKYDSAKISEKKLVFKNAGNHIVIKDLEEFLENGYVEYLENNMELLKKAVIKYQKDHSKDKDKPVLKGKKGVAVAGIITLAIISATAAFGKHKDNTPVNEPIGMEIEADEEYSYYDDVIITDSDVYTVGTTEEELNDDLIQELEMADTLIEEAPIDTLNFDYNKAPDLRKAENAKTYQEIVDKYANKWGISPNIVMSMLTQESGGYETNLMQIQFYSWEDQVITQYDFTNERYQSIVLTRNPGKYAGQNITCIEPNDLKNPITNISVGTCILRQCMDYMDNHIVAGIQCYNFGYTAMQKVLAETERETGISQGDLLDDQTNIDFLDNTSIMGNYGDPNYFYNISIYTEEDDSTYYIINHDDETNTNDYVYLNINNLSQSR